MPHHNEIWNIAIYFGYPKNIRIYLFGIIDEVKNMSEKITHIYCTKCKSKRITKTPDSIHLIEHSMDDHARLDGEQSKMMRALVRYIMVELRCGDCGYTVGYKKQVIDYTE